MRNLHLPRFPAAMALALGLVCPLPAGAYPNEPDGFEETRWGQDAVGVFDARKEGLRAQGYRRGRVARDSKRSTGGVWLKEVTELHGFDEAEVKYFVGPTGLFKAQITLEDPRPMAALEGDRVIEALTAQHGPPSTDPDKRRVWHGKTTVITLEESPAMSGLRFFLTYVRTADWEPAPLKAAANSPAAAAPPPTPARRGPGMSTVGPSAPAAPPPAALPPAAPPKAAQAEAPGKEEPPEIPAEPMPADPFEGNRAKDLLDAKHE